MAKRKKRMATRTARLKVGKTRGKANKKVTKRVVPRRAKKTSRPSKRGAGITKRARARQQKLPPKAVVQDNVIDVLDEPLPGVLRVTEIEEVSVAVPDEDDEGE